MSVDNHVLLVGAATLEHAHAYAKTFHHGGDRRDQSFVTLTCDELPAAVLESELFGHCRGSFPGAYRDMAGALERAGDGTLFLYRIDRLPAVLAQRLQDSLTDGAGYRVGNTRQRYAVHAQVVGTSPDDQWSSNGVAALFSSFSRVRLHPQAT